MVLRADDEFDDEDETSTKKTVGKRDKDPIPAWLRKVHEQAKSMESTYNRHNANSQKDRERFRAMANTVIPSFERILLASKLADEADNRAFLKRMLGR